MRLSDWDWGLGEPNRAKGSSLTYAIEHYETDGSQKRRPAVMQAMRL